MNRRGFLSWIGKAAAATPLAPAALAEAATGIGAMAAGTVGAAAVVAPEAGAFLGMLRMLAKRDLYADSQEIELERISPEVYRASTLLSRAFGKTKMYYHVRQFGDNANIQDLLLSDPIAGLEYARSLVPSRWYYSLISYSDPINEKIVSVIRAADPAEARKLSRCLKLAKLLHKVEQEAPRWHRIPPHVSAKYPTEETPFEPRALASRLRSLVEYNRLASKYVDVPDKQRSAREDHYQIHSYALAARQYSEKRRRQELDKLIRQRLHWTQHTRDRRRKKHEQQRESMLFFRRQLFHTMGEHTFKEHRKEADVCMRVIRRLDDLIEVLDAALLVIPEFDKPFDWLNMRKQAKDLLIKQGVAWLESFAEEDDEKTPTLVEIDVHGRLVTVPKEDPRAVAIDLSQFQKEDNDVRISNDVEPVRPEVEVEIA